MDNIITALSMAWSNFLSIPCPIRKWDAKLRNLMLAFLPVVGLIVGMLWFLLGVILNALPFPALLCSIIMTVYIYGISGFEHLKGFGNCGDAVISRGQRRRNSGPSVFSIVAMVAVVLLMVLAQWALMRKNITAINLLALMAIPIISRAEAGDSILKFNRRLEAETSVSSGKSNDSGRFVLISTAIAAVFLVLIMLGFKSATAIRGIRPFVFSAIVTLIVTALGSVLGKNSMREMNGDAASFAICLGEVAGVLALVFGTVA